LTAFGFFYPRRFRSTCGKTAAVVKSHGGPNCCLQQHEFNSILDGRGFAVLDDTAAALVTAENTERLQDGWGIVDVDDCANGAKYLTQKV